MIINFTVARVSSHPKNITAVINNESMDVVVQELEVELVSSNPNHGSLMLRFIGPSEINTAREIFIQDKTVDFSVSLNNG